MIALTSTCVRAIGGRGYLTYVGPHMHDSKDWMLVPASRTGAIVSTVGVVDSLAGGAIQLNRSLHWPLYICEFDLTTVIGALSECVRTPRSHIDGSRLSCGGGQACEVFVERCDTTWHTWCPDERLTVVQRSCFCFF